MRRKSTSEKVFGTLIVIFLVIYGALALFPLLHVFAQSLSSASAIGSGKVFLWPVETTFENYQEILKNPSIWQALRVSIFITVVGTIINLVMTASLAYPLSRDEYKGKRFILLLILFVWIFNAPLIPNYLLLKELGMVNTLWALMIPNAITTFNLLVMRSFFLAIPKELIESARMDGAGELRTLWSIILPLSKPVMATMCLLYAVMHWNTYTAAIYYIQDASLMPIQVKLAQYVKESADALLPNDEIVSMTSEEGIKMAVVVIAAIPIIILYPFLQKHFVKGMTLGAVKD
ncbi:carbohydrate ABC transporter permease [Bacillus sinesaloumensis]|uniref:carbohydrate ABC transporter permease n=1 Tax=Litchfieldia sinesaloumensis TaxID=1926280 RepID=UPI00098855F8|nr:carbohydrate ABC transporter permease [Bacillus sinesaloumensis]